MRIWSQEASFVLLHLQRIRSPEALKISREALPVQVETLP
jgi:hypothetical protein